jgi:O-methyltransferase involved in polyketide biosynthesis
MNQENFDYFGVSRTAYDALTCKLSADLSYGSVYKSYLEDVESNHCEMGNLSFTDYYQNYANVVVKKQNPLLNRFYFFRQQCVHSLFQKLLLTVSQEHCQIFIFGGGLDISFEFYSSKSVKLHFHIIDLPEIIERRKLYHMKRDSYSDKTIDYYSGDLLQFPQIMKDIQSTNPSNFNVNYPTIVIFECVLSYLPMNTVCEITDYFSNQFHSTAFLQFDPLLQPAATPSDKNNSNTNNYHHQIVQSFSSRNALLQSSFPLVTDYFSFYYHHNWKSVTCMTLYEIIHYYHLMESLEPLIIKSIETFDEYSSLQLLLNSYQITLAFNNNINNNSRWRDSFNQFNEKLNGKFSKQLMVKKSLPAPERDYQRAEFLFLQLQILEKKLFALERLVGASQNMEDNEMR